MTCGRDPSPSFGIGSTFDGHGQTSGDLFLAVGSQQISASRRPMISLKMIFQSKWIKWVVLRLPVRGCIMILRKSRDLGSSGHRHRFVLFQSLRKFDATNSANHNHDTSKTIHFFASSDKPTRVDFAIDHRVFR